MKCPNCGWDLLIKKKEDYKLFWICMNAECEIVSVIMTTTTKINNMDYEECENQEFMEDPEPWPT